MEFHKNKFYKNLGDKWVDLPIAITDNLNFGNPEKPETMGYIVKAIEGMAEACGALDFPVVSGNVSLYNETDGIAIPPTPVVGGVGLIEDLDKVTTLKGAQPGDILIAIADGDPTPGLGASLYLREILGREEGPPPLVNLEKEKGVADFTRSLVEAGLVNAVHDVSDGGYMCAATELCLANGVGAKITFPATGSLLGYFVEHQGSYMVAVSPAQADDVLARAQAAGIYAGKQGDFGGDAIVLNEDVINLPLARIREAHESWLPNYMSAVD